MQALYFPNARYLEDTVLELISYQPRIENLVLACQAVNVIGASTLGGVLFRFMRGKRSRFGWPPPTAFLRGAHGNNLHEHLPCVESARQAAGAGSNQNTGFCYSNWANQMKGGTPLRWELPKKGSQYA